MTSASTSFQSAASSLNAILEVYGQQTAVDSPVLNLKKILLFGPIVGTVKPLIATLLLDEITCHVAYKSQMKIQNRSKGADDSSTIDDINNNPIQGKVYTFNGAPRTSVDYMNYLQYFDYATGIMLTRAAQVDFRAELGEPPNGRVFNNAVSTKPTLVMPGQIITNWISGTLVMKVLPLLKKINFRRSTSTVGGKPSVSYEPVGKTQIVGLEDVINFNTANKIYCAYECENTTGVYLTMKKKNLTQQRFDTTTFTNLTP